MPSSMPPSFLLASFLLISLLTTRGHAKIIVTHAVTDNDFRRDCAFDLDGNHYDLCPLVGSAKFVDGSRIGMDHNRGEGSSSGKRFYEVALGGLSISDDPWARSSNDMTPTCDGDTWVCMLDMITSGYEDVDYESGTDLSSKFSREGGRAIPIAKKTKGSKITVSLDVDESKMGSSNSPLRLFLDDRGSGNDPQSTKIELLCSEIEEEMYLKEEDSVHSFVWATPHGCPKPIARGSKSKVSITEEAGNEGEEPAPGEEKGDDDLLPNNNNKTRRWMAITMVLVTSLVCGFILFSSARARHFTSENLKSAAYTLLPFLSQAAIKLRPIGQSINSLTSKYIVRIGTRFRVGDSQLVRWAQEDMALTDSDDLMVNGSRAYDGYDVEADGWNADGLDEYIPLTISPKYGKSRRVRSYGATPDMETFSESGTMSGIGRYFRK